MNKKKRFKYLVLMEFFIYFIDLKLLSYTIMVSIFALVRFGKLSLPAFANSL